MSDWRADPRFTKECSCDFHTVPHWLWMDAVDRERTRKNIERLGEIESKRPVTAADVIYREQMVPALAHGIAEDEVTRLRAKRVEMERRGISEIPPDLLEQIQREREAQPALWAKRHREEELARNPLLTLADEELDRRARECLLAIDQAATTAEKLRLQREADRITHALRRKAELAQEAA